MDESSFYSVDRLVEFGMSLAVATQMANSMNQSLSVMQIPGARNETAHLLEPQVFPSQRQSVYYVVLEGEAVGPLSPAELSRLISEKRVTKETYVWKPGMAEWRLAETLPEVLRLVALTPPPIPDIGQS